MKQYLNLKEAANIMGITLQGATQLTLRHRLKYRKINGRKMTTLEWIEECRKAKWSKQTSYFNGKRIFNKENGIYSIKMVQEMTGLTRNQIFYRIRIGELKTSRKGSLYVIIKKDLEEFLALISPKKSAVVV